MSDKILMAHGAGGQRDVASNGYALQRFDYQLFSGVFSGSASRRAVKNRFAQTAT